MKKKLDMLKFGKYIIIYVLLVLFIIPFFLMIVNSFKTTQQFVQNPFALPTTFSFVNYVNAFKNMNFANAFFNSVIITTISVFFILITSSMAAYFLVRIKTKVNKYLFALFVASMIIPFQAIMIPLVSIYGKLQLLNSKWILIFMYIGFGQAFAIFIFHGFIKNIPMEIEEAALIDGCSRIQMFFKIVLPLLKPVFTTVLVLDVLWIWNDFLLPSIVLLAPDQRTLPLSMYSFFSSYSVDFAPLMAGIVLTILPVIIIYIICQKQIIEGVVQGAKK